MSLISSSVPNLVGGVSQQPSPIRRDNQFESQKNVYATLIGGLRKRPPTIHVSKILDEAVADGATVHFINRDPTERYAVLIETASIRVFDLTTGDEKTVTAPDGFDYIDVANPRSTLRAMTVADYTFIWNRDVEVEMSASLTASVNPEALFYVKQGNYGRIYQITINGTLVAQYNVPDGSSAAHSVKVATSYIAAQLWNHLNGLANDTMASPAGSIAGSYTLGYYEDTIHIRSNIPGGVSFASTDGFGGNAMICVKGRAARFTDLSPHGPANAVVEITGDQGVAGDNFFVRFDKTSSGDSTGVWRETVAPGIPYAIDATTMPHQLVRNGDGTFTFQKATWINREVGDATTNPEPSFVGRKINDMFFHRNRLGVVAGENTIYSASGDFFRYWRKTVTTLLDDDPVDVANSHIKASTIFNATPFKASLLLFSDTSQFELGADTTLTPKTATITPTTEYNADRILKPIAVAASVFFGATQGDYTQIREYYYSGDAQQNDAYDTTAHCPRYLPAGMFKITASTYDDVLCAVTAQDPAAIYVYKWFGTAQQRVQSAWTRWEIGGTILGIEFIDSNLYVAVERDGEVWLEYIPMAQDYIDSSADFVTYLDRRVSSADLAAPSYNSSARTTTFTLPYAPGTECLVTVRGEDGYDALAVGTKLVVTSRTSTTITVSGDHTETPLWFGFAFSTEAEFSRIHYKQEKQDGRVAVADGRLQLRYMTFMLGNTGYLRFEVTPQGRQTYVKEFTGAILGGSQTVVGAVPIYTGRVKAPVLSRSDQVTVRIINDTHLPLSVLSMEWEGVWSIRNRRI